MWWRSRAAKGSRPWRSACGRRGGRHQAVLLPECGSRREEGGHHCAGGTQDEGHLRRGLRRGEGFGGPDGVGDRAARYEQAASAGPRTTIAKQ